MRFFAVACIAFASFAFSGSSARASEADNVTGWAWSGSIGWLSMNCTNTANCADSNFGVKMEETPGFSDRSDLSGYAWSEAVGWICFGMTCAGTTPEGGSSYAQYRVSFNGKQDQVWGWAQVLNMGTDGWISLNCDKDVGADDCASSDFFVSMDPDTGNFTNGVVNDHWGWGANDLGEGVGWVDFSGVNVTWVTADLGTITRPEGVYEPTAVGLPGTRQFTFPINFTGFSGSVGQLLECEILLPDDSRRVLGKTLTSSVRDGAQSLEYTMDVLDTVERNRIWYIDACRIAGATLGAACATDADCAPGGICDEGAGACRLVVQSSTARRPIYTHGNAWSGLEAAEDQYSAVKCNAGFPNEYFKNAAQCEYTGDASFALVMRRGIPIEGNCGDGIDNDGNGQIDCLDRYCQGISYRCQTLARTSCMYGETGDGVNDCSDPAYQAGDLCCTQQPQTAGSSLQSIVDGMECSYGDPNDGYFDCDCAAGRYGEADCHAPGYQDGDLCCSDANQVERH